MLQENLVSVYEELGFSVEESVPLNVLYEHPIVSELIHACVNFERKV